MTAPARRPQNAFRVLGAPTVLGPDGRPLSSRAAQRHRLALLALLAVARPGGLTRDRLVGLLWPERDDRAARHLLSNAIYELRQALGARAILVAGEEVRLDPGQLDVDLHAFEDALARGALRDAVSTYGGPFLDGLFLDAAEEFERWVSAQRARLAHAHEQALEALAEEARAGGRVVEAIGWLDALARARPADGGVARRLIEALASVGDRAGALARADAHAAYLAEEVGIAVGPEVAAIVRALRAEGAAAPRGEEPREEAPVTPREPATPAPSSAPLAAPVTPRRVAPAGAFASPRTRRVAAALALAAASAVFVAARSVGRHSDQPTPGALAPRDPAAVVRPASVRAPNPQPPDSGIVHAVARGDRERFDAAVAGLAPSATPDRVRFYGMLRVARWDAPEQALQSLAMRFRMRARSERFRPGGGAPPQLGTLLAAYVASATERADPRPDLALAALDSADAALGTDPGARGAIRARRVALLATLGRLAELRRLLDECAAEGGEGAVTAASAAASVGTASTVPRAWFDDAAARFLAGAAAPPDSRGERAYRGAVLALGAGDAVRGRALLHVAASPAGPGDGVPPALAAAVRAAGGIALALDGDTVGAIRELRAGLADAGADDDALRLTAPLRARLASLEASQPATRGDGIDRLHGMLAGADGAFPGELRRDLARALEAAGARDEAAEQWSRLATLLAGADRTLRPLADSARARAAALARRP